jgi:hypothetical protein
VAAACRGGCGVKGGPGPAWPGRWLSAERSEPLILHLPARASRDPHVVISSSYDAAAWPAAAIARPGRRRAEAAPASGKPPLAHPRSLRPCKLQSYQVTVYKQSLGVPRSAASLLTFVAVRRGAMPGRAASRASSSGRAAAAGRYVAGRVTEQVDGGPPPQSAAEACKELPPLPGRPPAAARLASHAAPDAPPTASWPAAGRQGAMAARAPCCARHLPRGRRLGLTLARPRPPNARAAASPPPPARCLA